MDEETPPEPAPEKRGLRPFEARTDIPWDMIRARFEAGSYSYKALSKTLAAEGVNVSHETIRRKAMAEGWVQAGLADAVKTVKGAIQSGAEPRAITVVTPIAEPEVMRAMHMEALRSIEIVRQHRSAIAKDMVRLDGMAGLLDVQLANELPTTSLQINSALTNMEALSRIRERLVRMERQAFGLGDDAEGEHVAGVNLTIEQKGALTAAVRVRLGKRRAPEIDG